MQEVFELSICNSVPYSLKGFSRAASMFEVLQLGLPTQEGLVVTGLSKTSKKNIYCFLKKKEWKEVLIRSDKKPETDFKIKGGYLIKVENVLSEIQRLLNMGRIVLLLEPVNKYENLYGINLLIAPMNNVALLEIVGQGFDVTDINRGDITPHERIWLEIKDNQITSHIVDQTTVNETQYANSVKLRLAKIGRESISSQRDENTTFSSITLEQMGLRFLQEAGFLSITATKSYSPLPNIFLKKLVGLIKDLPWQLPTLGDLENEYIISTSVISSCQDVRFVFWDIVRPSRKYDIRKKS